MFKRPHHQTIANVLLSLNGDLLRHHHCYFGGDTAIALLYGEYRESVDIDFVVSNAQSYSALRELARNDFQSLFTTNALSLSQRSELRIDQYGIQTQLTVGNVTIKFEIIREARITLETPNVDDCICKVSTLTPLDRVTTKLLANSDRWLDASVFSRNIIDLAMIKPTTALLRKGIAKAETAYGHRCNGICKKPLND